MSLLIKGVQVVDGKGSVPFKADVLVQKNVISAIGNLKNRKTDKSIDGLGHYLVPGFIDAHTNADHYLNIFQNPSLSDFAKQGITTIIGGHCGASLAPTLYGDLSSLRKWADPRDINVDWSTLGEFFKAINKMTIGVNFATFAGHSTMRRAILGDRSKILENETAVLKNMLKRAMKDGALGLSSGLQYVHGKHASKKELKTLIDVVSESNGVFSVHLRNETKDLVESVKEIGSLIKGSGANALISHLRPIIGFEKEYEEALQYIHKTKGLYFDVSPYAFSVRLIYTLLPEWAQTDNLEAMLEKVRDKKITSLLERDMKNIDGEKIIVGGAPHHEYLVGRTISQIAENRGVSVSQALLQVMNVTGMRAVVFTEDVNQSLLEKALTHDKAFVVSHGKGALPGEFLVHNRSIDTFPKFIRSVVSSDRMSVEESVERVTSRPAKFFGLKNRGFVKEGCIADLVILGREDLMVKNTIIGGKVFGEDKTKGEILRHKS